MSTLCAASAKGKPLEEPRLDHNFAGIKNLNNYTGYTYDYVLDLYFAQNRFYNADTRQFITQDPIKDGMNWYVYCEGNPLVNVDWLGYEWIAIRSYMKEKGGSVSDLYYDDYFHQMAVTLQLNDRALSVAMSGETGHGIKGINTGLTLYMERETLDSYFHGDVNCDTTEVTIPKEVIGTVNGNRVVLYPTQNWGAPGRGAYPAGVQKDAEGRYKVAVGPGVVNANYPDSGKIWLDYDGIAKNIKIDVELKHNITGETKIIECVVVDYKAHTYNIYPDGHGNSDLGSASFDVKNGLIQTGISYPNSWNAGRSEALSSGNVSGNVIEFAGHEVDFRTNDYTLVKIVVKE